MGKNSVLNAAFKIQSHYILHTESKIWQQGVGIILMWRILCVYACTDWSFGIILIWRHTFSSPDHQN